MEITTLLEYSDRSQLRAWLQENHTKEKECWIDSTLKKLPDGRLVQRLSPRRKKSHWTKLNMDRCINLDDRGLMTPAGKCAFENAYGYESLDNK